MLRKRDRADEMLPECWPSGAFFVAEVVRRVALECPLDQGFGDVGRHDAAAQVIGMRRPAHPTSY